MFKRIYKICYLTFNKKFKKEVNKKIKNKKITLEKINDENIANFKEKIKNNLTDPRQKKKITYKLWDIVITVFLAIIANCDDWDDIVIFAKENYDFLRKHLKMTGGIPTAITYERVIAALDKKELEKICIFFLTDTLKIKKKKIRDIINIDGKTDNGSSRTVINNETGEIEKIKSLNVLSAYSNKLDICVASEMIEDKTNEITSFPDIIERLNIRNKVITVDALNTQKENCKLIKKKRGDYVMALKANQGTFYDEVTEYFDEHKLKELKNKKLNYHKESEKRGKEIVTYEYFQTTDIGWYQDKNLWKGLKTIGMVKKTFDNPYNKEKQSEIRYYISSLDLDINLFSYAIRIHWSVENKLHGYLDMTFKQDKNTTIDKEALFGLQLIKKMCLSTLRPIAKAEKISLNKLRLQMSYNMDKALAKISKFYGR